VFASYLLSVKICTQVVITPVDHCKWVQELTKFFGNFEATALPIVKTIVEERMLPAGEQTIFPIHVGGIAGAF
jgi:hypothetical protein